MSGDAVFNDTSFNVGTVTGDAVFNNSSSNYDPSNITHVGVVNGTITCNTTALYCPLPPGVLMIGNSPEVGGRNLMGHIDEFRITKGSARYRGPFSPPRRAFPTTTLLLNFNGDPLDSSGNDQPVSGYGNVVISDEESKFGGSSAYFDGDWGSFLTAPSSNFGTGDFTIELWFKSSDSGGSPNQLLLNLSPGILNSSGMILVYNYNPGGGDPTWNSVGRIGLYSDYFGNGLGPIQSGQQFPGWIISQNEFGDSEWHHVAAVRSGDTFSLYVDGHKEVSATVAGAVISPSVPATIGQGFHGYMNGLRFIKGSALYLADFTPKPNQPASFGEDLKVEFEGGASDVSGNEVSLEPGWKVQTAKERRRFGNGSAYFPGNSSQITASSDKFVIGNQEFLVDFWIFPESHAFDTLVAFGPRGFYLGSYNFSGGLEVVSENGRVLFSETALALNEWQHIALARKIEASGGCCNGSATGTLTLYMNGTSVASASCDENFYSTDIAIGGGHPLLSFNGYIDNFRLFVGTSVYSSDFTPNQSPTWQSVKDSKAHCILLRDYDSELHEACGGPYQSQSQCSRCESSSSSSSSQFPPCFPSVSLIESDDGTVEIKVDCTPEPASSSSSYCLNFPGPNAEDIKCPDGSTIGKTYYIADFKSCSWLEYQNIYGSCDSSSSSQENASSSSQENASSSSSETCSGSTRHCLYSNFSLGIDLFSMVNKPPPCKTKKYCVPGEGCKEICPEDAVGTPISDCYLNGKDCCLEGWCLIDCYNYLPVENCTKCYGMWFADDFAGLQRYIYENCRLDCWECDQNSYDCNKVSFFDKYVVPKTWKWLGLPDPECELPLYKSEPDCVEECCECDCPCTDPPWDPSNSSVCLNCCALWVDGRIIVREN